MIAATEEEEEEQQKKTKTTTAATISKEQVKTSKYSNPVPKLSDKEYQGLKDLIARDKKLCSPIIINVKRDVLDRHHRLEACKEVGIEPRFEVKDDIANELEERIWVKEINRKRRQLNEFQDCEIALSLLEDYKEKAKLNMSLGGKGVRIQTPLGRSDDRACADAGCKRDMMHKVAYMLKAEQRNPERYGPLVAQLRNGTEEGKGEGGGTTITHKL